MKSVWGSWPDLSAVSFEVVDLDCTCGKDLTVLNVDRAFGGSDARAAAFCTSGSAIVSYRTVVVKQWH